MSLLKAQYRYFPHSEMPQNWTETQFRHDEPMMNFIWLTCPEADDLWETNWAGNELTRFVRNGFHQDLRVAVSGPPLAFIKWWRDLDENYANPYQGVLPANYNQIMASRAQAAHRRLFGANAEVIKVDFRTKRRIA